MDPRVRLGGCLALLALLPTLQAPAALAGALGAGLAAAAVARLAPRDLWRRLAAAEGFLVALVLTLPFTLPGEPAFAAGGLVASHEGLQQALVLIVRVNAGLLLAGALVGTLGTDGLARAMAGLGLPPVLVELLRMTVRYVGLLDEEYQRLRRAMRARGFRPGASRHAWRSYGHLVGMLVLRSLDRAERVRWAMACRGYSGRFLAVAPGRLGAWDLGFAVIAAALALTLLWLDR